jgi:rhodanese-related sulfurtransferase
MDMSTQAKAKISRITIDEAKERMNEIVFVDARSTTALSRNPLRVPGAIHVPAKEVEKALKRLPRNRTLVTYCT